MKKLATLIALCTVVCATTLMSPVSASTASDYDPNMGAWFGVMTRSIGDRRLDDLSKVCLEYGWRAEADKWSDIVSPSGIGTIQIRQITLVDQNGQPRLNYVQRMHTEAYENCDMTMSYFEDEQGIVVVPAKIGETIAKLEESSTGRLTFDAQIDFVMGRRSLVATYENVGSQGGIIYITEYSADEKLANVYSTRVADNGGIAFPLNHNTARVRVMLLDPHGISITEPIRLNIRNRITAD